MTSVPFYRRPISLKATLRVVLTPIAIAAVAGLLWLAWNARPLFIAMEYGVETPAVPSPNAHDLYLQAAASIKGASPREPAVAVVTDNMPQDTTEDPKKYPLAGKIQWLAKHKPAFEKFDKALQTPYLFPPVRSAQPNGEIELPYSFRWLARCVTVECQVLAAQRHNDKAVDRAIDIWKMGIDAARGAPMTPALTGVSVELWARRAIDGEIAHLNGPQAAQAARRFEKLLATRVAFKDILREERNVMLFQMKPLLEKKIHDDRRQAEVEQAIERGDYNFNYSSEPAPTLRGPIINWVLRRQCNQYVRGMDVLLANADAPWSRRQIKLPMDLDYGVANMIQVLNKGRFQFARNDTFAQLTLARLALHAYRKDKGVYPPTLQALAPAYIDRVPHDPFADNQPLRYRLSGKSYKLWSIGPDAHDDAARPALNPSPRRPSDRYVVRDTSTGDIVVNINR